MCGTLDDGEHIAGSLDRQSVLRSGDPWGVADLNQLLEHGKRRTPVVERLKDPCVRYLLVTSAALSGGAKSLRTNCIRHEHPTSQIHVAGLG